ncbi:PQQ-dependent sugar dehydrogenase [uncultured Roseobacter sp.]|uniref:PQQ-dependent sugar dehydrogenase n=1 Tax=uncultured Roseobacter sp. TaxID=114847 RepID=UPI0026295EC1|nr:PQQ-dependent sugar dehydrogenase [uncultured Roseobacter sp.]
MRSIVKVGLVGVLCGVTMAAGAALAHFDTAPYKLAKKAVRVVVPRDAAAPKTAEDVPEVQADDLDQATFPSILPELKSEAVTIPATRSGTGGALTPAEDGVILLTHDGLMYHATGPDDVTGLKIELPENGFLDYQEDAVGRFSDLEHLLGNFRYNDILMIQRAGGRELYASFTRYFQEDACFVNAIARLSLPDGSVRDASVPASDWETVFETAPCLPLKPHRLALEGHMAGGRMAFDGDQTIYMGSGDYHFDGSIHSPDLVISNDDSYEYGKVMALNIETLETLMLSRGNRNMQGLALLDGALYVVEHGARGGDELNRIEEGGHYGWPYVSLGSDYNKQPQPGITTRGRHDGYEKPVFSWLPSVAISSLKPMSGVHEDWDGDLLMGSLKARSLFRIRIEGDRVLFAEQIPVGQRVRYAQPLEGQLVLWTDDRKLMFITPDRFSEVDPVVKALKAQGMSAEEAGRLAGNFVACRECHSVSPDDSYSAPTLANIFGAPIATGAYSEYSDALRAKGGVWDREALTTFLTDPESFASGTSMPGPELSPGAISETIMVLEALSAPN